MSTVLENPVRSLLKDSSVHRFTRLWELVRRDGQTFRFADCNVSVDFQGDTYVPAGGFSSSATQHVQNAEASNVELQGIITSDAIDYDDLRFGLYEDADLTQWIVDWRYPWAGAFKREVFKVGATEYSDDVWTAQIQGRGVLLLQNKGRVVSRSCPVELGSPRCGVLMGPLTVSGNTVTNTIGIYQRLRFTCDLSADFVENVLVDSGGNRINDGWFNDGDLTWTTGTNAGQTQRVRKFIEPSGAGTDGVVWLYTPTQFDIQPGDTFSARPGCNKLPGDSGHCQSKFKDPATGLVNNIVNFQGSPFTPGQGKVLQTPGLKS